jgi:multisubunit Na+/H+ antiporter MnhC subunit
MPNEREDQAIGQHLRVARILCLAMSQGIVVLVGVGLYLVLAQNRAPAAGTLPVVSLVAGWFLLQNAVLAALVPPILVRVSLRKIASGR